MKEKTYHVTFQHKLRTSSDTPRYEVGEDQGNAIIRFFPLTHNLPEALVIDTVLRRPHADTPVKIKKTVIIPRSYLRDCIVEIEDSIFPERECDASTSTDNTKKKP